VLATVDASRRVVIAEDDPEMRRILVEVFRDDGYDVLEAEDGVRLLIELKAELGRAEAPLDLIVSDIRMPVYGGLDVLNELRRARRPTPVLLITGFGDDEVRAAAEALGATLLEKPFAVDELRTVASKLSRRWS
jgi:CheY-like chemotaxis protein